MTYKLSKKSILNLKGLNPKLIELVLTASKTSPIDFAVTEGLRSTERQMELFKKGYSKCDGVKNKSNHQKKSDGFGYAVDLAPLPIDYDNKKRFKILSDHIKATAKKLGIKIV